MSDSLRKYRPDVFSEEILRAPAEQFGGLPVHVCVPPVPVEGDERVAHPFQHIAEWTADGVCLLHTRSMIPHTYSRMFPRLLAFSTRHSFGAIAQATDVNPAFSHRSESIRFTPRAEPPTDSYHVREFPVCERTNGRRRLAEAICWFKLVQSVIGHHRGR